MISTKMALVRGGVLVALCLAGFAGPAGAQSVDAEPTDLRFAVVNATTGQPGTIDRLTIDYVRTRRNTVIDFEPGGSEFIAPGVPIKEAGEYVVTAWSHDVPYWWSMRGRDLVGKTTTLHVFDTTDRRDDARITGLNLVVRRQDSLVQLEYMLQVENTSSPQVTITDRVASFELNFPRDARQIEATYRRGPDPTPFAADTHGSSRLSLPVPLTPGTNQIRIAASLPWQEGLTLPVGANLDIAAWSVLGAPDWLEIRSIELEPAGEAVTGFTRQIGPPLLNGRELDLQMFSGEHAAGEAEDLFTQATDALADKPAAAADADKKSGGLSLPLVFSGVLIIIVVAAAIRKRRQ